MKNLEGIWRKLPKIVASQILTIHIGIRERLNKFKVKKVYVLKHHEYFSFIKIDDVITYHYK